MKNSHQFVLLIVCASVTLLISTCGTVPVPFDPIVVQPSAPQNQNRHNKSTKHSRKNPNVAKVDPVIVQPLDSKRTPATDIFTPKEHIQNAISYLQVGKAQNAYAELQLALKKEPNHNTALELVKQITRTPDEFFKNDAYFSYTTQVGDSLSTIAKKFLNDPYQFYILSKFNEIDNPSRLRVGQTIKIPGTQPKNLSFKTPRHNTNLNASQLKVAQRYYDSGKYQTAIDLLENVGLKEKKDTQIEDLLVLSYTKYSEELAGKAELLEAHTLLKKALSMQPKNKKLHQQLKHIENRQEADRLYKVGLNALQDGEDDKAYDAFKGVLKLEANHTLAKKQITNLKSEVIDTYYKEGMAMYRRHQLNDAIVRFDKILKIDEEHEMAKLYRARAFELKKKLEILEKDSN